jgi:hypothetical protein
MLPSLRGPSKRYINLVIWSRPELTLSVLEFPLPDSSSCTSFLPATSYYFFGNSLQLKVSTRKLKLSSSIAVVLQASQSAVIFYQFKVQLLAVLQEFSGYNLFLPFSSSIVTVLQDFSGNNGLLPIFKFNCNCTSGLLRLQLFLLFSSSKFILRSLICLSTSNYLA